MQPRTLERELARRLRPGCTHAARLGRRRAANVCVAYGRGRTRAAAPNVCARDLPDPRPRRAANVCAPRGGGEPVEVVQEIGGSDGAGIVAEGEEVRAGVHDEKLVEAEFWKAPFQISSDSATLREASGAGRQAFPRGPIGGNMTKNVELLVDIRYNFA